jgi:hypothetical protein
VIELEQHAALVAPDVEQCFSAEIDWNPLESLGRIPFALQSMTVDLDTVITGWKLKSGVIGTAGFGVIQQIMDLPKGAIPDISGTLEGQSLEGLQRANTLPVDDHRNDARHFFYQFL